MKRILALLAVISACVLWKPARAEESALEMNLNDSVFRPVLQLVSGTTRAGIYPSAGLTGTPVDYVYADTEVTLLGAGNKWWRIRHGETEGYVSRNRMELTGTAEGTAPVSDIVLSSSLRIPGSMVRPRDADYILPEGTQELSETVDYIAFFLWDEWQRKLERTWLYFPEAPTAGPDASQWTRAMPTKGLSAGRKTLCIEGISGDRNVVLARIPFFVAGKADEPVSLNSRCVFEPHDQRLLDARVETCWTPTEKHPELTVTLPDDGSAALLRMEWYAPPDRTEITVRNDRDETIRSETLETGFLADAVALPEEARTVTVRPYGTKVRMASVRVYDRDYPREMVQQWQAMPDKLDILLFSTHQDDEILFFSGLTPWYSHLGKKIGIVYMADCGRNRYREALDGMWISGLRIHPVFLGFMDKEISSMQVAANIWPGSQEAIVRQIRRCKPDIIVVQDRNGEYGHTQHKLTSEQVCLGAEYAADPAYDPESVSLYGTWDVPKLYVHLYEENPVHMNWNIPLAEYGGFTPWEVAVEAFEMHHSQYGYFRMERQSVTFDSSCFGLYRSNVGPDTAGDDMFENIR